MVPTVVNLLGDTIKNLIENLADVDTQWIVDILDIIQEILGPIPLPSNIGQIVAEYKDGVKAFFTFSS